ncbi:MAG: hypothetical protein J7559_04790 [Cohnella sp.]|nr:hypothetical protein [Cohnella sp.]
MNRVVDENYVDPVVSRWINDQISAKCQELKEHGPRVTDKRFVNFETLQFDLHFDKPIDCEGDIRWSDEYSVRIPEEFKQLLRAAEKLSQ